MTLLTQAYLLFSAASIDLFFTSSLWFLLSVICYKKITNKMTWTFLSFLFLIPVSIVEWNYRVDDFNLKSQNKNYSMLNVAGVYNLTFIMSTLGSIAGYPETGFEMMYFSLPKKYKKKEVYISSDFALESEKIRGYISKHIKSKKRKTSYNLVWTRAEHKTDSSRVALALNGASKLTITNKKDAAGNIYYHCNIKTSFHMNDIGTKINIGKYTVLRIEEGIFSGMQKINAFTPYVVNWSWNVISEQELKAHVDFPWFDDLIEKITSAQK